VKMLLKLPKSAKHGKCQIWKVSNMESAKEGKHFEIQISKIHFQILNFKIQLIKKAKSKDHMFPLSCHAHSKFKIAKEAPPSLLVHGRQGEYEGKPWAAT